MIPVSEPLLNGNERKYLLECLDSGWISAGGPFVQRFEQAFGETLGMPPGVAVCNGTAALETALYGLGVQSGDEVIMPSFTIVSCATAALRLGAVPVVVDIDPNNWCMDVEQLAGALSPRTKVIMPVHMYGHPVDMDVVMDIAQRSGASVLEDAAEVHGAEYFSSKKQEWQKCGAIGHASSFSFYANKIVTTGEGGMVLSRDNEVLKRARSYQNLCFRPEQRFLHTELGYNFRMTSMQAAIGCAQVERMQEFISIKRRNATHYAERLRDIPELRLQPEAAWARSVHWMHAVELNEGCQVTAVQMMSQLRERGIEARPFFLGLHEQPVLKGKIREPMPCKYTESAYRRGFYLPSGMNLTAREIDQVCDAVRAILRSAKVGRAQ